MITLNNIIISGRLTQDPDVKEVGQKAKKLAKFGIAYNREFGTAGGRKKETLFIDVQTWEKQADFIERYLKKGDTCIVEGELVMEQWRTKIGEFKSKIAIRASKVHKVFSKGKDEDAEDGDGGEQSPVSEEYAPPVQQHRYTKEDCADPRGQAPGGSYQAPTEEPMYDNSVPF